MAITCINPKQASAGSASVTNYPAAGLAMTSVTAGSYIYVAMAQATNNTAGINVPSDTQVNTYTQFGTTLNVGTGGQIAHFYAVSAGGANTVTGHFATAVGYPALFIAEIAGTTGPDLSGTYHHENSQSGGVGTGAGAVTSGNCVPSTQPGLIIGASFDSGINNVETPYTGGGYTDLFGASAFWQFTSGANKGGAGYLVYASTSAIAALFTAGASNTAPGTVGALFVQTAGGALTLMPFSQTQFFVTDTIVQP